MTRESKTVAAGCALAALAAGAFARPPAEPESALPPAAALWVELGGTEAPPIERLVELALERSPRLAELAAKVEAARARIEPAGALANPMIELRLQHMGLGAWTVGEEEMSMVEAGVRQALPYPGKRAARREAARAAVEVAVAEAAAARRTLRLEVERAFSELYAADGELAVLDAAHELLELLSATVAARYATGGADQEAVLKVQLALSRHDARREGALRERAAAEAELRRLAALPDGAALGRAARLPPPAPLPANFAARAAEEAPEVAVARAAAAVAERMLAVERLELLPDFSVGGGLGWRGDLDPAVVAGVGIELPFWRRQRQEPLIRAAESELAAARAAERAAAVTARGAAERLLSDDLRLERQLRLYDEAILPQTSAALDAARASYLAARGDFSMVLEDFELWLDARAARARLDAERFAIRAAIAALVGPAPERGSGAAPGGVEP